LAHRLNYRERFQPSAQLAQPYVMLGLTVVAAQTDAEARRLFTSLQQAFINLRTGRASALPPPVNDIEALIEPGAHDLLQQTLSRSVVGGPATVKAGLNAFVARNQPDELILTAQIFDHAARRRSFEIVGDVMREGTECEPAVEAVV
jgi:alkanesulfonate monooxygenase SsuD/methylene tetrahydromethanopterin reductase-like flavin-dependent oxidoreductase (luciferase family)